jgi:hypothetical protein
LLKAELGIAVNDRGPDYYGDDRPRQGVTYSGTMKAFHVPKEGGYNADKLSEFARWLVQRMSSNELALNAGEFDRGYNSFSGDMKITLTLMK